MHVVFEGKPRMYW